MSDQLDHRQETKVIHAGQVHEPITGAVMQPVFQTSTYAQPWPAKHTGYEYARTQNPTREAMERAVAALEGGTEAIAFASGLAATATIIQTLSAGDLVICGDDVYGGTYRLFMQLFQRHGLRFQFVDLSSVEPEDAIPADAKMVWLESPTNPLLKITDIAKVCEHAHAIGAQVVVDNTFATPIFQQPLSLGADFVLHSITKYINGHSDVVGGIVVTKQPELAQSIRFLQNAVGAVPGPWDTWLTLRGIKTLAIRMERHQSNAQKIVEWLCEHPEVSKVHYPLLKSDPGYAVASKQMTGFGGMISFVLKADLARAEKFCASTKLFTLAESLGGVESLIELPASMTHASIPADQRQERGIVDGLIRLSVGIEHVEDLINDLETAMALSRSQ
jgi:cystathionine gamma-lyase